jgi:hypothetical protein
MGFNEIVNLPTEIPTGISGIDENHFFYKTLNSSIPPNTKLNYMEIDPIAGTTYRYITNILYNNELSFTKTISLRAVWSKDIYGGLEYFWNGSSGEDISDPGGKSYHVMAIAENDAYQVTNSVVRKFGLTTVTRPSGATGKLWNNGHYWDGTPPYTDALKDIRRIVRKFKPVSTSGRFARIFFNKKTFVYPIGENYEEDASGNVQGPYLSSYLVE